MLRILIFTATLFLCTVVCSFIWGSTVADHLYNCTDPLSGVLDYLLPGNWVHGKIQYVSEIRAGRPMDEPDTIKAGWSRFGLWSLWGGMFGASILASLTIARRIRSSSLPPLRS